MKKMMARWFITASGGMAFGLFATLIAGTIVNQIGRWTANSGFDIVSNVGLALQVIGIAAQLLMGAGIGAGVAHSLKAEKLVLFSAICAGFIGAQSSAIINVVQAADPLAVFLLRDFTAGGLVSPGEPVSAFITSIFAVEVGQLIKGRTKIDIVALPLSAIFVGAIMAFTICPPIARAFIAFGNWIMLTTEANPLWMGFVLSVSVGLLLTMPTSSAAICIAVGISGLAGGAAVVGGASHMICFAVMSWRENKFSGLVAQGLGTSMLQIPNVFRNPRVLIPPVFASAVAGPLAAFVFQLHCSSTGSGMGTSGLVGLFTTITASLEAGLETGRLVTGLILLFFVIPTLCGIFGRLLLGKVGWIKDGDLQLEL